MICNVDHMASSSSALAGVCCVGVPTDCAHLFIGRLYSESLPFYCFHWADASKTSALLRSSRIFQYEIPHEFRRWYFTDSHSLIWHWIASSTVILELLPSGCIIGFEGRHEWITFLTIIVSETCKFINPLLVKVLELIVTYTLRCYRFVVDQIL